MNSLTVAIIGNGVVGQATARVIKEKHKVVFHDPIQGQTCDYKRLLRKKI